MLEMTHDSTASWQQQRTLKQVMWAGSDCTTLTSFVLSLSNPLSANAFFTAIFSPCAAHEIDSPACSSERAAFNWLAPGCMKDNETKPIGPLSCVTETTFADEMPDFLSNAFEHFVIFSAVWLPVIRKTPVMICCGFICSSTKTAVWPRYAWPFAAVQQSSVMEPLSMFCRTCSATTFSQSFFSWQIDFFNVFRDGTTKSHRNFHYINIEKEASKPPWNVWRLVSSRKQSVSCPHTTSEWSRIRIVSENPSTVARFEDWYPPRVYSQLVQKCCVFRGAFLMLLCHVWKRSSFHMFCILPCLCVLLCQERNAPKQKKCVFLHLLWSVSLFLLLFSSSQRIFPFRTAKKRNLNAPRVGTCVLLSGPQLPGKRTRFIKPNPVSQPGYFREFTKTRGTHPVPEKVELRPPLFKNHGNFCFR